MKNCILLLLSEYSLKNGIKKIVPSKAEGQHFAEQVIDQKAR